MRERNTLFAQRRDNNGSSQDSIQLTPVGSGINKKVQAQKGISIVKVSGQCPKPQKRRISDISPTSLGRFSSAKRGGKKKKKKKKKRQDQVIPPSLFEEK